MHVATFEKSVQLSVNLLGYINLCHSCHGLLKGSNELHLLCFPNIF